MEQKERYRMGMGKIESQTVKDQIDTEKQTMRERERGGGERGESRRRSLIYEKSKLICSVMRNTIVAEYSNFTNSV